MDELDDYVSAEAALDWLTRQTGAAWTLSRLVKHCAAPWFWLDVNPAAPDLSGGRSEGHLARLMFNGDIQRLAIVQTDVLVTMFTDHAGKVVRVSPPFRMPASELRFARADVESLAEHADTAPAPHPKTKGTGIKKTALVKKHSHHWPTIESDLSEATRNGLSAAWVRHGWWDESAALAWAENNGKVRQALTMSALPGRTHLVKV